MLVPGSIRKVLALLRGRVSPVLAGLAVGLGFWFGLMPGFSGIHAVLVVALGLLNIPIGGFIVAAGLGKAASLAIAPALYHLGVFIQGHVGALTALLSRVPIVAITDFNRPALVGALVAGPLLGLVLGIAVGQVALTFRRTWLRLEGNSDKLRIWQAKGWVRALDWIMLSGSAKDAQAALSARTVYVRKGGVILAVLLLVLFAVLSFFFRNQVVRAKGAEILTRANGATVDLDRVDLSLASGKVAIAGMGFTDSQRPSHNKFQVAEVYSKADLYQLSLGRLVLDQVRVSDIGLDRPRTTPGQVLPQTPEDPNDKWTWPDVNMTPENIVKYIQDANQIRAWIAKIRPFLPSGKRPASAQAPHKYLEYLAATTPNQVYRMLAKSVVLDKVRLSDSLFGTTRVTLSNLNDAPVSTGLPIDLALDSEQGPKVHLTMHFDSPETAGRVTGAFEGLDLGKLQSGLSKSNAVSFQGGKAAGRFEGRLTQQGIDLTIAAQLSDLQAAADQGLLGLDAQTTKEVFNTLKDLDVKLQIAGPLAHPRIAFDTKGLQTALRDKLVQAGKQRAADELNKQIDRQLGDKLPGQLKDVIKPGLQQGLKGILGGAREPNTK
ncbi:MAG: hypothetical protein KBE04_13740 [Phycisphaerae bacterium]|nr:hypothetical protein [Phycisphaerae bacterium]